MSIKNDNGDEFDNVAPEMFFNENGFQHNFSASRTPKQNGVVERKSRTLQEMTSIMLNDNDLPKYF